MMKSSLSGPVSISTIGTGSVFNLDDDSLAESQSSERGVDLHTSLFRRLEELERMTGELDCSSRRGIDVSDDYDSYVDLSAGEVSHWSLCHASCLRLLRAPNTLLSIVLLIASTYTNSHRTSTC
jgi:hypothetical protein